MRKAAPDDDRMDLPSLRVRVGYPGQLTATQPKIDWFSAEVVELILEFFEDRFGKLLRIYVVLSSSLYEWLPKCNSNSLPSKPIYLGGAFVVTGGLIMTLCKNWSSEAARGRKDLLSPPAPTP